MIDIPKFRAPFCRNEPSKMNLSKLNLVVTDMLFVTSLLKPFFDEVCEACFTIQLRVSTLFLLSAVKQHRRLILLHTPAPIDVHCTQQ
jgi:hypothetical protein